MTIFFSNILTHLLIMNDISEILRCLLDQYSQLDDVDNEFQRMISEDDELKKEYDNWCEANGYNPKTGYQDYLDELLESQDSIWENIGDE